MRSRLTDSVHADVTRKNHIPPIIPTSLRESLSRRRSKSIEKRQYANSLQKSTPFGSLGLLTGKSVADVFTSSVFKTKLCYRCHSISSATTTTTTTAAALSLFSLSLYFLPLLRRKGARGKGSHRNNNISDKTAGGMQETSTQPARCA